MARVNLSRINSAIKSLKEEGQLLARRLRSLPEELSMDVLEGTGEDDIRKFREKCEKARAEILASMKRQTEINEKICELRAILDKANRKSGVNDLLLKLSNIQSRIDTYERLVGQISERGDGGPYFGEMKDAAFYKSALNEKNRVYEISVSLASDEDIRSLRESVDFWRRQRDLVKDSLAALNQNRTVEVPDALLCVNA